jgi:hypothetical protein
MGKLLLADRVRDHQELILSKLLTALAVSAIIPRMLENSRLGSASRDSSFEQGGSRMFQTLGRRPGMKVVTSAVRAALALAVIPAQALASCPTRHFYNNSNYSFTVNMINGGSCSFQGEPKTDSCVVPPKRTLQLHYNNFPIGGDAGQISFSSDIFADTRPFDKNVDCYIIHESRRDTGNIALNAPAAGDVTTCGADGYACQGR